VECGKKDKVGYKTRRLALDLSNKKGEAGLTSPLLESDEI
jgi:hypothetical protein